MSEKKQYEDVSEQMFHDMIEGIEKGELTPGADMLKKGIPITYRDDDYPDYIVKEYPDGRRQLVDLDDDGHEIIIREIK